MADRKIFQLTAITNPAQTYVLAVQDAAGTAEALKVTIANFKTALALAKADVGLSNVDNTSDTGKPVSIAQQTALDLKANLASPALTGTPTAPTAAPGTNTTQVATTAFVQAGLAGVGGGSIDSVPTDGSSNAVQSNGVFDALALKKSIVSVTQASHGFTVGMAVQKNTSGTWIRCRAVPTSNLSYADGIVISVPDANTFLVGGPGESFNATGLGLATNTVYLLDTTSSGINYISSTTAVLAEGDVYKELFKTNAANQAFIINGPSYETEASASGTITFQKDNVDISSRAKIDINSGNAMTVKLTDDSVNNKAELTISKKYDFEWEFLSHWQGAPFVNAGANFSHYTGYSDNPGRTKYLAGTGTTAFAYFGTVPFSYVFDNANNITYRVRQEKTQPDTLIGANVYTWVLGFINNFIGTNAVPSNGAYFKYSNASANWQIVTVAGGTATTQTTSVVVDVNPHTFEVTVLNGVATFYIDEVSVGTISTNVPNGTGQSTGAGGHVFKTSGTGDIYIGIGAFRSSWHIE